MKTTTTLALAASILAVQADASLFDFYPKEPNIRPANIHHTAIDTADHRHGFLNSISDQKHSMVAVGVGGCFDEPGKPCVQKSGGVITVAVAAPHEGTINTPPSFGGGDGGSGEDGHDYNEDGSYAGVGMGDYNSPDDPGHGDGGFGADADGHGGMF